MVRPSLSIIFSHSSLFPLPSSKAEILLSRKWIGDREEVSEEGCVYMYVEEACSEDWAAARIVSKK